MIDFRLNSSPLYLGDLASISIYEVTMLTHLSLYYL